MFDPIGLINSYSTATHRISQRGASGSCSLRIARIWSLLLIFAFVASLEALPAFAQQGPTASGAATTATISGTITTKQADTVSVLGGVTVTLTAQPPADKPLSMDTDDSGKFEFKGLQAGAYTISITQQGFKFVTKAVTLTGGQEAVENLRLDLETLSTSVEVHEQTLTMETESATPPTETITQRQVLALPTTQEKVREVLPVTPGVVKTLDAKLSFKGADETQSLLMVNSTWTIDPVTGSFSVPVPTDAVRTFAVFKTPYDASFGGFTGGLTTIDTKPPPELWEFRLKNIIPSVLGKNGKISGIKESVPTATLGGPLMKGKLLFSEVFQYEMRKQTVRGLPWPHDISKRQGFNSFTTLDAIVSPKQTVSATLNVFPLRHQFVDINALVPQPASNDLNQKGQAVTLSDKYVFDSGSFFSVLGQYTQFGSDARGQGPADMLITPEGWGGNFFNQWSRKGREFQVLPSYQLAEKHWYGRHLLSMGMDVNYRSYTGQTSSHPLQILRQDGSLAETITFNGQILQSATDTAVAEYLQDHWILDSHWALNLGARVSSETTGRSMAFSPRAGVAYAPGKDGRTVIRAGAGLFYSLMPLLAADFSQNPARAITLFDTLGQPIGPPVTFNYAYVGSQNPLSGVPLPQHPGTAPKNLTWNVEVERQVRKNVIARVSYIDSHTTNVFTVNPFQGAVGAPSFIGLTNQGSAHYHEVETTVHFTFRKRDEANASYIWSRSRGDLNNLPSVMIPFAEPVILPNVHGILPNDVPNRFVAWGIISMPWKLTLSPVTDVHTGYAYSNIDVLQNYVGAPNGQRFATYFSLDGKLYREFRIPFVDSKSNKGRRMRLGVYMLNVTNHGNFIAVFNNVTAPNFGQFAGFNFRTEGVIIDFVD
jgi:hypothetical protein